MIQSDLDRPDLERPDLERRFGGLRRLHGDAAYERLRGLRLAVVGLGGVGSWAAEALARSGVAALTLIDLDHVSESNVNRQVQALGRTLGQAKAQALAERIADIHPGCDIAIVEDFVAPIAYTVDWLILFSDKSKVLTIAVVSTLGVIVGAFVSALATRSFRWEGFAGTQDTAHHLMGAVLMGVGGVTAMGCTVGQGLSGLSTLALGSFVAFAGIVAGAVAGLKYQVWQLERSL